MTDDHEGKMIDIVDRLKFDATRCELQFSKGVAGNISEAAREIETLRALLTQARDYGNRGHSLSDGFLDEIDAALSRS